MSDTYIFHKIKNWFLKDEAYSSKVERTAHNGFVVGSSPTKPKQKWMGFNLKTYKRLKIRHYFKKINLFFFFHGTCLNNANWVKVEQLLNEKELRYLRIMNTLLVAILKHSIFKNLTVLIHGPILLLHINNAKSIIKKLNSINLWVSLLCLKLNNKIYSSKQISNLNKLSYSENVCLFYNSMRFIIKMPYYKFKNEKIIQMSK